MVGLLKKKIRKLRKRKKVKCFNYGGLEHFSIDYVLVSMTLKKIVQATWSDTYSSESDSMTFEDTRYEKNDYLNFIASVDSKHDTNSHESEYSNE